MMGEFAFGESFHCLEKAESHFFVRILFDGVDTSSAMGQLERYKVWTVMRALLPKSTFKIVDELNDMVATLSQKRQSRGYVPGDTDMFNYLLQNKGEDKFSQKEYEGNALTLLFAGADTTATVMIFGSYLLCKNPTAMKRVQEEVRGRFRESGGINATNTGELKYMAAVLSEIMRLYPPGPNGLARIISSETGQSVAGHHVPHGVSVHISRKKSYKFADSCQTDIVRRLPISRQPTRRQLLPCQRVPPRAVVRRRTRRVLARPQRHIPAILIWSTQLHRQAVSDGESLERIVLSSRHL
jgi:hypothetical protein